jgi:hypothetical protein
MCRRAGFRDVQFVGMWDVNTRAQGEGKSMMSAITTGRAVFHLYK